MTWSKRRISSSRDSWKSPAFTGAVLAGTVTITESTTTLCVIPLSSGAGSCVLSATALPLGVYSIVATYSGNPYFSASASPAQSRTVAKAASKTALKLSEAKVTYGDEQAEKMSVTVTSAFTGVVPSGTVTITESTRTLCVITLSSGAGSCVLSATAIPAGTYSIVATYSGDAYFGGSASPGQSLTVKEAASTTSRGVLKPGWGQLRSHTSNVSGRSDT